jgi:hypothetical protein
MLADNKPPAGFCSDLQEKMRKHGAFHPSGRPRSPNEIDNFADNSAHQ